MALTSDRALQDKASALLQAAPGATPREIEQAYLQALTRLKSAFLDLGGFESLPQPAHMTFDAYVEGEHNAAVLEACRRVCASPGAVHNPLFIYGKSGLGKTHLLSAMARCMRQRWPERHVLVTSADAFTQELVNAIADHGGRLLSAKYRSLDVLLIDSVQCWNNRAATQEEAVAILDHLVAARCQVVFTSNCAPRDLGGVMEALSSRFSAGLSMEIAYPDLATRRRIVEGMARRLGVELSQDVTAVLVKRIGKDVRALEGALQRLAAHQNGQPWTPDQAERLLFDVAPAFEPEPLTTAEVLAVVAGHFSLDAHEVTHGRNTAKIKRARQIGMYLSRALTNGSLQEVGRVFAAGPNQVQYAERAVKNNLDDPVLAHDLCALRKRLERPCNGAAAAHARAAEPKPRVKVARAKA